MEYRTLGRTGMQVSTFCLGTMVLGAWGNRDEDECQAIIQTALDAGGELHRHGGHVRVRRVGGDRRPGAPAGGTP